jgi:putative Holliday junction resolvase
MCEENGKKRFMGLDIGRKYVGVALSDRTRSIASARETILRKKDLKTIEKLVKIIEEEDVSRVVVGLPLNLDGSFSSSARDASGFAEKLSSMTGAKVVMWDERFSSKEAEAVMLEASLSRKKRRGAIDKLAAQIILQNYLDSRNSHSDGGEA